MQAIKIVLIGLCIWGLSCRAHALVILQYHHIDTQTPAATSTAPDTFAQHLKLIKQEGFEVITLEQVASLIRDNQPLPDKTVLISFDDSYSSIFNTAFPLLKQYNYPFVVFANTAPVQAKQKGFMTWEQLKVLTEHGGSIANHTASHTHMVRKKQGETLAQWRERITQDIQQANQLIKKHTGQNHRVLAYPYGEFNPEIQLLLEDMDYLGVGQHSGPVPQGERYAIPRFPMGGAYGGNDDFLLKLKTLPLNNLKAALLVEDKHVAFNPIISAQRQPTIVLSLNQPEILDRLNCYVSPKGDTHKERLSPSAASYRARAPLAAGRSRYNCTAKADQGRYYWLSFPFIARQANGEWVAE